jgi:carbon-monoxide dehydrogenase medium subunit
MQIRDHFFPENVKDAVDLLCKERGKARLIAGGTDLAVTIRNGKNRFEALVDISKIPGFSSIMLQNRVIEMGAGVTMALAEENDLIMKHGTALAEGCSWVGGPQIRNRATIVGNIVSAQPAADAAVPLFVLDAMLHVVGAEGSRTVPIGEAYKSVGESAIDPTVELVTAITFEIQSEGEVSAFKRMMRRKAMALPVLNCAVWIRRELNRFADVRIVLGPVASTPVRVIAAEDQLKGKDISSQAIREAALIAAEFASPRSSPFRGSNTYRKEMVSVIVEDAFHEALSRFEKDF